MSPTESQLRQALREGEGDGVDAGLLIANANRIRRERRRRINAGIGVAAVVGVLGSFALLIGTRATQEEAGGGSAATRSAPGDQAYRATSNGGAAGGAAGRSARASAVPSPPGAYHGTPAPSCPRTPVHVKRSGGSSGSLVPAGVSSISACAYRPDGTTVAGALVTQRAATEFADSLNAAPHRPARAAGPCVAPFDGRGSVQLRVYDSHGTLVGPLTVVPDCHQAKVTNGAVTRYPRHLPPPLPRLLRTVR
jgi:hypothetical protein